MGQAKAAGVQAPEELRHEYRRYRSVGTPIVQFPGVFAGGWMWEETWTCLRQRGFPVLRLLDAVAASDRLSQNLATARATLKALLDRVAPGRYILCGNSLGGLMALDFARHHPDRVTALVVSGAPGLGPDPALGFGTPRRITTERVWELARTLFHDPARITPEMVHRVHAVLSHRHHLANLFHILRAVRDYDMDAALRGVSCPALFLWGANDRVTPPEPWREAARGMRHAEFHAIPECGHSPMVERPQEFNRLLLDFLRRRLARVQAA